MIRNFLLFFTILNSVLLSEESSYLHQTISGTLSKSWKIKFKLFVKEFKGVILHCEDSGGNYFTIYVRKESNYKSISITYNDMTKMFILSDLCGCDPCFEITISFNVGLENKIFNVTCNKQSENLFIFGPNEKVIEAKNTSSSTIRITIGNSINSKNSHKSMSGCLDTFYYGQIRVNFTAKGTKVLPTCPIMCINNICNNGVCKEKVMDSPTCDCSETAKNGQYCNRSLLFYKTEGNNSYHILDEKILHIKFTWKQILSHSYCLINFVGRYKQVTLWINKNHLILGSDIIADNNEDGINFVTVTIYDNNLIVKVKGHIIKIKFLQNEYNFLNLGFANRFSACETFQGAYDIYFNQSHLRPFRQFKSQSERSAISMYIIVSVLSILTIVIIVLCYFCSIKFIRKKGPLPDNIPGPDIIALAVDGNANDHEMYSDPYSVMNYQNMYVVNTDHNEDIDGYILPGSPSKIRETPLLPLRMTTTLL